VLFAYGFTFISMEYYLSTVGLFSGFVVWFLIAFYRSPD